MKISELDPQVIIVLAIMVIGAIRWFLEQVKGNKNAQDASERAASDFEDLYEEARREIQARQSSGPQGGVAPPPIPIIQAPRSPLTPKKPVFTTPPPVLPDWSRPVRKPTLSPAEKAALARVQAKTVPRPTRSTRSSGSRIRRLLASPSAARDAIIFGEILGPPKGAERPGQSAR